MFRVITLLFLPDLHLFLFDIFRIGAWREPWRVYGRCYCPVRMRQQRSAWGGRYHRWRTSPRHLTVRRIHRWIRQKNAPCGKVENGWEHFTNIPNPPLFTVWTVMHVHNGPRAPTAVTEQFYPISFMTLLLRKWRHVDTYGMKWR